MERYVQKERTITDAVSATPMIHFLPDFIEHGRKLVGCQMNKLCADSGYDSEENHEYMERNSIEAYVKYN